MVSMNVHHVSKIEVGPLVSYSPERDKCSFPMTTRSIKLYDESGVCVEIHAFLNNADAPLVTWNKVTDPYGNVIDDDNFESVNIKKPE